MMYDGEVENPGTLRVMIPRASAWMQPTSRESGRKPRVGPDDRGGLPPTIQPARQAVPRQHITTSQVRVDRPQNGNLRRSRQRLKLWMQQLRSFCGALCQQEMDLDLLGLRVQQLSSTPAMGWVVLGFRF